MAERVIRLITVSVNRSIPVFSDETVAQITLQTLNDNLFNFNSELLGYVLMPAHIRMIIRIYDTRLLDQFVQTFKILSAKRIKKENFPQYHDLLTENESFNLWQEGYDDQRLESKDEFKASLEHIHSEPVKAGLCEREVDWSYSSASAWIEGKPGLIDVETSVEW